MSETKLCPFRKSNMIEFLEHDGTQSQSRDQFAPCLQEKCAMWRQLFDHIDPNDPEERTVIYKGYCGLAGKP
jgi:hypothetical protein